MGKKSRKKTKLPKASKTLNDRQLEINNIKNQIEQLGLGEGNLDIKQFYQIIDEFTNTGIGWSGRVTLNGFQRHIDVILTNNSNIKCQIRLVYDQYV